MKFKIITILVLILCVLVTWGLVSSSKKKTEASRAFALREQSVGQSKELSSQLGKSDRVSEVLRVVEKLTALAKEYSSQSNSSGGIDEKTRQGLQGEIDKIKSVEQLLMTANIMKSVIADAEAGDASYDNVLDEAYWFCVKRISENTSEDASLALEVIKNPPRPDGGNALMIEDAIKQHNKNKANNRK